MQSNRDDFVIAIRSAFLHKGNKQRFSLIGLIFFSILILTLGKFNFKAIDYLKISVKELIYHSSFIASIPENSIEKIYFKIAEHLNLYEDYTIIKYELDELRAQKTIDSFIILENIKLKRLVDDYIVDSNKILAKVLLDKKSPFLRSIVINKGSKNKINLGMAVLNNKYLVGKVVEVNYLTSRVLLLSDLNSKIPVTVEPGNMQSILSGTGKNHGVIQYLKENFIIEDEARVYTSGAGGLFKPGIPIGFVESSEIEGNKNIAFFSNFSQLKFVQVVSFEIEKNQ